MIQVVENYNILNGNADIIVIPVNCEGVMGAGLAKDFKEMYFSEYVKYRKLCSEFKIMVGGVYYLKCEKSPSIVFFPTKREWRRPSQYSYIKSGLISLNKLLITFGADVTVDIPAIGCGLGGLNFEEVSLMAQIVLRGCSCNINIVKPK